MAHSLARGKLLYHHVFRQNACSQGGFCPHLPVCSSLAYLHSGMAQRPSAAPNSQSGVSTQSTPNITSCTAQLVSTARHRVPSTPAQAVRRPPIGISRYCICREAEHRYSVIFTKRTSLAQGIIGPSSQHTSFHVPVLFVHAQVGGGKQR